MVELPFFVNRENKFWVFIALTALAVGLYLLTNHFHPPAQYLPMTWMDQAIPFIPRTVWIYWTDAFLLMSAFILCRNPENLNKFAYSFFTLQAISVAIFIFWPTTYPRDLYPLPSDLDDLTFHLFSSLRITDTPANCCPSLHVSGVFLSSFIYLDEDRRKFPFYFTWASAVAVSTLTTKQHYIVDVVTGIALASFIFWLFHRKLSYRRFPAMVGVQPNR